MGGNPPTPRHLNKIPMCSYVVVCLCYACASQMVWIESPTNPTLKVVDIAGVAEIAHRQPGVMVVVDNTFMTPYFQVSLARRVLSQFDAFDAG